MSKHRPTADEILLIVPMDKAWSKEARDAALAARRAGKGKMEAVKNEAANNANASASAGAVQTASSLPKSRKEAAAMNDQDLAAAAHQEAVETKAGLRGYGSWDSALTSGKGHASTEYRSRQRKNAHVVADNFFKDKTPEQQEAIRQDIFQEIRRAEKRVEASDAKKQAEWEADTSPNKPKYPPIGQYRGQVGYAVGMQMIQKKYKVPKEAASKVITRLGITDMMFSG